LTGLELCYATGHNPPEVIGTYCDRGKLGDAALNSTEASGRKSTATGAAKAGISFGTALAIAISWNAHKSILWAIIHGLLSWLYVIYFAMKRG
jgi:hypothetical protein